MVDIRKEIEKLPRKSKRFIKDVGKKWKRLSPLEKGKIAALSILLVPVTGGLGFKYLESTKKKKLRKVV